MANVNVCDECKKHLNGKPPVTMGIREGTVGPGGETNLSIRDFCSKECLLKNVISGNNWLAYKTNNNVSATENWNKYIERSRRAKAKALALLEIKIDAA